MIKTFVFSLAILTPDTRFPCVDPVGHLINEQSFPRPMEGGPYFIMIDKKNKSMD
jgi:hypothetical protein